RSVHDPSDRSVLVPAASRCTKWRETPIGTTVAQGVGMMTKTVVGLAFLGASFLLGGCGCDPGNNSQRVPVTFDPSSSDATRDACGSYTLKLLGDTTVAPPYTLIELDLAPSVVVGQQIPLWVSESGAAHSSDGTVAFSLQAGSSLDATPLASVVVTPNA